MTDGNKDREFRIATGGRRLQVTAYCGQLKFTGIAHVGIPSRTTSRRPSDILFFYAEKNLKLADVRIFDRGLDRIVDEPPFVILNISRMDAIYAEEMEER